MAPAPATAAAQRTSRAERARAPEPRPRARTAAVPARPMPLPPQPTRPRAVPTRTRPLPGAERQDLGRRATRRVPQARLVGRMRLLDRIVRGRAWIPVLGILLVGIVAMRVEVLKLGARVGVEMQQASALQSADEALSSQVSALSRPERIESEAARMGMRMPLPADVQLVQASAGRHVRRAIADIARPAPQLFLSGLESEHAKDSQSVQQAANTSAVGVLGGGYIPGAG